jgi:hypothetical protein
MLDSPRSPLCHTHLSGARLLRRHADIVTTPLPQQPALAGLLPTVRNTQQLCLQRHERLSQRSEDISHGSVSDCGEGVESQRGDQALPQ